MDLLKLKYFYVIAKYENISSAAKELLISQSALSKAIRALEDELEMDLFFRNGKRIVLNDNGKLLFKQTERIFNELDDLDKIMVEQRDRGDGRFSIITTLPYTFTNLINSFIADYPSIFYEQLPLSKENLELFIENGKFDICLSTEIITHPNVTWIPLVEEEIFVTVPATFPQESFSEIDLKKLQDIPFVGLSKRYAYRQLTDLLCSKYRFNPEYRVEVEEATAILQLVKNGYGASFTPQTAINLYDNSIKHLRIKNGQFLRSIGLIKHNNRYQTAVLGAFIDHCHQFFKENLSELKA